MTIATPQPTSARWRAPLAWTAIFFGSLAAAAIVAPLAYAAIHAVVPDVHLPLSRLYNRSAMLAAVGALIWFRRDIGWDRFKALWGNVGWSNRLGLLAAGWAASALAIGLGIAWAVAVGRLGPSQNSVEFIAVRVAPAIIGGLLAGLIEETFFRGLMLGSLARAIGRTGAVVVTSAAYAAVHLLISDRTFVWTGYRFGAGFSYVIHAVGRQLEPASVWPLLGLFIGGVTLALVVMATDSLWVAVGLHAGWAFAFQIVLHATGVIGEIPGASELAQRHFLVGNLWVWVVLVTSGVAAAWWVRRRAARYQSASDDASTSTPPDSA